MVEIEEIEDPELDHPQPGPIEEDEDSADYTDTDSSVSTTSVPPPLSESLSERLYALRDMLSPTTRRRIVSTSARVAGLVKKGAMWGGKGMWVVSTSALMIGIPWALAFVDEQSVLEMEAEQKARESAGEVLSPGASTATPGRAAL